MKNRSLAILVVDSRAIVRGGLAQVLSSGEHHHEVETVATLAEAGHALRRRHRDVAIIQIGTRHDAHAFGMWLVSHQGRTRFLLLSPAGSEHLAVPLLGRGVAGCVSESAAGEALLGAVEAVSAGLRHLEPPAFAALAHHTHQTDVAKRSADLSAQERTVLALLSQGLRVADIASNLRISQTTVNTYKHRIRQKIGLKGMADMIRFAVELTGEHP